MIDHLSTYGTDFEASKRFYDAVLTTLEHSLQMEMVASWDEAFPERRMCAWGPGRPQFWLVETRVEYTPRHFAFTASSRTAVDAFHAAAMATGAPGSWRARSPSDLSRGLLRAFALDPDGNNVEAVCHAPA